MFPEIPWVRERNARFGEKSYLECRPDEQAVKPDGIALVIVQSCKGQNLANDQNSDIKS